MSRSPFIEALERGVIAHQAGRLDDALKSYRAALELRPNDPEASSLCVRERQLQRGRSSLVRIPTQT
jgi:predicted RNA polymerase sigma factor